MANCLMKDLTLKRNPGRNVAQSVATSHGFGDDHGTAETEDRRFRDLCAVQLRCTPAEWLGTSRGSGHQRRDSHLSIAVSSKRIIIKHIPSLLSRTFISPWIKVLVVATWHIHLIRDWMCQVATTGQLNPSATPISMYSLPVPPV